MKKELLALIISVFANNLVFGLDLVPPAQAYDPACLKITSETEARSDQAVEKVERFASDHFGVDLNQPILNIKLPSNRLIDYNVKYNLRENSWRLKLAGQGMLSPVVTYNNSERYRLYLINKGIKF
ncbi:MAG: hypothetical protein KKC80_05355 [Candidatus Margulisbacteria bacterium]|nr:hypothetical protein [Candidatus Margulisiibacteriota bacterium]MBU1616159.1 hypothetical protein [Candidatus Margulisiibacteriota bacterium]MBU1866896.1 hypothetical protein [Candidatus Margulisiibacteriota bacterium]